MVLFLVFAKFVVPLLPVKSAESRVQLARAALLIETQDGADGLEDRQGESELFQGIITVVSYEPIADKQSDQESHHAPD